MPCDMSPTRKGNTLPQSWLSWNKGYLVIGHLLEKVRLYLNLGCPNVFSADLLGLLYNLMSCSVTVQQQLSQNKGFLVIGHLLEKVRPSLNLGCLGMKDFL